MRTAWVFLLCALLSTTTFAATDEGIITQLYTDSAGNVAVKLAGGFPNSVAASECVSANPNGWAGVAVGANAALKAALLAAKASQSLVSLSISGCEASGAWMKITAVYVK